MRPAVANASLAGALLLLASCSGSSGGGTVAATSPQDFLTQADVERIVAQAVGEAQAHGVRAHIVVVDRVGNVAGAFRMTGAPGTVAISSGLGVNGGLDGIPAGTVPASHSALAKAITGAYLSSNGNAFSTRTAGQIIREHFNPQESRQPSGPLYGVQFSQLVCSDVTGKPLLPANLGPKPSPLGLSADPGGLPLYKNGVLVGGIGIEADGIYRLDRNITDIDDDVEEHIAVAGTFGFAAPADIRGDRITADGRTLRYIDSESSLSRPADAQPPASLPGTFDPIAGYALSGLNAGTSYGSALSGIRRDDGTFAAANGWIVVNDHNANRFPSHDAADGSLRADEVRTLLAEALAIAQRARAQIRRPLGSFAQVSIAVVDRNGDILGLVRTADAPVFGIDVSVQKARTAMFFSHPAAGAELLGAPAASHLNGNTVSIATYASSFGTFTASNALAGAFAWTPRAIGNLHRPFFPDGIDGSPAGPLSTPIVMWSPFNVGFQLDLVYNQLVKSILGDVSEGCAARLPAGATPIARDIGLSKLRNGAQIFPGGVPIYRGDTLLGAIGVSGDGVDQDDMVAYLGLQNGARILANGIGNAPAARRADTLTPMGARLRYVQCPQAPFNDSAEQNVCQ